MSSINISGIVYYTLSVSDLDRSIKWYCEKLGFQPVSRKGSNKFRKIAYISNRSMTLKLVEVTDARPLPSGRSNPGTDNPIRGNKHFSFRVDDGPQTEKEIRALRIPVVAVPVVEDTYGIFICDPTGNLMEILQEETPKSKSVSSAKLGSSPIAIKQWSHIGISVANTEESVKWYGDILGYTFKHSNRISTPDGKKFKITWLNAPNFCLEIFEVPGSAPLPPDMLNPSVDLKTLGNKFPTLGVKDINKAATGLKKLGVGITAQGKHNLFIHDRDGILIELVESIK
jgi:catechol 2,3-dioxygenase-like lactoylglutathione lyase family enzyme